MKRITTILAALVIAACLATAASAGRYICLGNVYDGSTPVVGAQVKCAFYSNGWCGYTDYSPIYTGTDGGFLMTASMDEGPGYYAVCVTYGTKWAHVINFYAAVPVYTDLGVIYLQGGAHPAHKLCQ